MKRRVIVLSVFLFVLLTVSVNASEIRTYSFDGHTGTGNDAASELFNNLPEEYRSLLPDGFENGFDLSISSAAENVSADLAEIVLPSLGCAARLIGILLIASVFYRYRDTLTSQLIRDALSFVITAASILTVFDMETGILQTASEYVKSLCNLMTALLTTVSAALAASGAAHLASVSGLGMMTLVSGLSSLFASIILPLCAACLVLAAAGSLGSVKAGTILRGIHYAVTLSLSALGLLFGAVIGAGAKLAASADTLQLQSVKFAVSSFVPFVGSALSGAFGTIGMSIACIRDAVGGAGIFLIAVLSLPALLNLALNRLAILLGKTVAEMLGCEREKTLLEEIGTVFSFVLAVVSVITVLFVFMLSVCLGMNIGEGTI